MKTAKKKPVQRRRRKDKKIVVEQTKISKNSAEEYKEKLQKCLMKYWSIPKARGHVQSFEHTLVYTLLIPVKFAGIFLKYFKAEHGIENLSYNYLNSSTPEYFKVFISKNMIRAFTKRLYVVTKALYKKEEKDVTP